MLTDYYYSSGDHMLKLILSSVNADYKGKMVLESLKTLFHQYPKQHPQPC
jgi:hypothetical protein